MNRKSLLTKVCILILVLSFCLVGCKAVSKADNKSVAKAGAGSDSYAMYDQEMSVESEAGITSDVALKNDAAMAPSQTTTSAPTALPENRKLIQTVRMTVETEDMDTLLSQLSIQINSLSGYVERQNIQNGSAYTAKRTRSAELTIRIPAENLTAFVDQVSGISNVVTSNKSVTDVTLDYVSTESRMNALKTEETRLLELLEMAKNMDDLLAIESRLTDVRAEIEQVGSTLRIYDNQVDYATVNLTISEVKEYTVPEPEPETLWERISTGFGDTLEDIGDGFEDFIVFLTVNSPYILTLAGAVILFIVLRRIRKKKKKTQEKTE